MLYTLKLLEDNCKNFSWIISPGEDWLNSQPGPGAAPGQWCPNAGLRHREAWELRELRKLGRVPGHREHYSHYFFLIRVQIFFHCKSILTLVLVRTDRDARCTTVRCLIVYHRKLSVGARVLFVKMICNFAKFIPQLVIIRRAFAIQFLAELIPRQL